MAKLGTLRALFSSKKISDFMDKFVDEHESKMLKSYQFVGEKFINEARTRGNYTDRTGNLRASIGYVILKNGKILDSSFLGNTNGKGDKGEAIGRNVASEIALKYQKGWVLIGVAGMDYAAYVEAKSFDVITGSAPDSNELKSILSEIKF